MRVSLNFSNMKDGDLVVFCLAIYMAMKGNPRFPKTPINLEDFKAAIDEYKAAITQAGDGSKKAISLRNKLRERVVNMVHQLGNHVSDVSEDLDTLFSSSFDLAYKYRRLSGPLPTPRIGKIGHGPNSGTLLVWIKPIPRSSGRVKVYHLRYAEIVDGVVTEEWIILFSTTARFPISVTNLKPGVVYAFQARAMNITGLTDWSDSATFMCT
jgi:hypothetical protein